LAKGRRKIGGGSKTLCALFAFAVDKSTAKSKKANKEWASPSSTESTRYWQSTRVSEEELDFIINYDIKYRMGDELDAQ
jgi:hypothetical protein